PDGDALTYSWMVNGHADAVSGVRPMLSWTDLRALGVTAAVSYTIGLTIDDGHGHVVTSPPVLLTVGRAALMVTAPSMTKTYGDAIAIGGTVSAVVTGDGITYSFASAGATA